MWPCYVDLSESELYTCDTPTFFDVFGSPTGGGAAIGAAVAFAFVLAMKIVGQRVDTERWLLYGGAFGGLIGLFAAVSSSVSI
jgi:hypothetical protein